MENHKIIFLLETLSTGGGERVASELSSGLPSDIEKIIVLLKDKISYPYDGKIISLDILKSSNIFLKIVCYLFGLLKFRRLAKQEKPDYVVSFGHLPNLINIFSGGLPVGREFKSIVRIDNFYSFSCRGFGGLIYKILVKLFFNKADTIVSVSKESARDLISNFKIKKEKIKVIYNPLNVKEIKRLSEEPLEEEYKEIFKNPVIINIGQLGKQKNHQDLIRSFVGVKNKIKNVKLVILGQGPQKSNLKKLVKKLKIENDVYFLGWQKNPFKFLANSKVFVLSSLWEGLPYVLLEAMACGIPVVSYDCRSGPREILAPETDSSFQTEDIEYTEFGILVEPENIDQLLEGIKKIFTDSNLCSKIKGKSKQRALDFDIKNIIKNWEFLKK
jgi:glycosyltransferase involved in cell wall biosynthesis